MFPPVFVTYSTPLVPSASHFGAPSVTITSEGVVETRIAGVEALRDGELPPAVVEPVSKLVVGCVAAHFVAVARSALPFAEPTAQGPSRDVEVIQPSATFNHQAFDAS